MRKRWKTALYAAAMAMLLTACAATEDEIQRVEQEDITPQTRPEKTEAEGEEPNVSEQVQQPEEEGGEADAKERPAVIESAILFEAGYEDICSETWYVYAPEEMRIRRLTESRGYSRSRCLKVMENQMGEKELRRRASAVIENDGGRERTEEQIKALLAGRKKR